LPPQLLKQLLPIRRAGIPFQDIGHSVLQGNHLVVQDALVGVVDHLGFAGVRRCKILVQHDMLADDGPHLREA
jgi:hypothetical protein